MLLTNFLPLATRALPTNYNQAYSLAPTGNWDGNDGGWSTFAVRVGTPPQAFRVLPSTSGTEIWVPLPDSCSQNPANCGTARGVEPFNAAPLGSSPQSGTPSDLNGTSVDAGQTCTNSRSPQCSDCTNSNGKCTTGPCAGRQCCGLMGTCGSTCMGLSGICTGQFLGCACSGPDYNAATGAMPVTATSPYLAQGFQWNSSSTWGTGSKVSPIGGNLGVVATGLYGTDTVGVGVDNTTGLTLTGGHVVGVNASSFYIGTLGLAAGMDNSSMLSQLFKQKMIPSLSYGYTAGALYRKYLSSLPMRNSSDTHLEQPPVLGSLTLGGYDAARTSSGPNLTSTLNADTNSIMVSVGSISVANALTKDETLLSIENNLTTIIDTTLPYTYLPPYVCQQLETAFGLQWDVSHQMYLVNDSIHQQLVKLGPSVTFVLSTSVPEPAALNITLPYAAFDLTAGYPIFPNGTNYFPLRRANSSSQFILGRQFMQEAYLFVDYETSQYTISQAAFHTAGGQNIVTIDHSINGSIGANAGSTTGSGLSTGAIAGTAIGASVAIVLLCTLGWFVWRNHHSKKVNGVWRAPVAHTRPSKGPSVATTQNTTTTGTTSTSEPEKGGWSGYSPPSAFQAYRSDKTRSMAYSDYQRQSQYNDNTALSPTTKANASPRPNYVSRHTDPWSRSEFDPHSPQSLASAKLPATGPTKLFSIMDESDDKALPLRPGRSSKIPPGSQSAPPAHAPWAEPDSWSPQHISSQDQRSRHNFSRPEFKERQNSKPELRQQTSRPSMRERQGSRPSLGGYERKRQDSYNSIRVENTLIVDTEQSDEYGVKPSVGSEASRTRQKHIWEMHAGSPAGSRGNSRGNSRKHSRKNTSEMTSPTAEPGVGTAL